MMGTSFPIMRRALAALPREMEGTVPDPISGTMVQQKTWNLVLLIGAGPSGNFEFPLMETFHQRFENRLGNVANPALVGLYDSVSKVTLSGGEFGSPKNLERMMSLLRHPEPLWGQIGDECGHKQQFIGNCAALLDELHAEIYVQYRDAHKRADKIKATYEPFFQPLLGLTGGKITIFTTNYDLALEAHFDSAGQDFFDGFDEDGLYRPGGAGAAPIQLYHLNGATDWHMIPVNRDSPDEGLRRIRGSELNHPLRTQTLCLPGERGPAENLSIRTKRFESPEEVQSQLRMRFRRALTFCDAVIIVGYRGDGRIPDFFREAIDNRARDRRPPLHGFVINGQTYVRLNDKDKPFCILFGGSPRSGIIFRKKLTPKTASGIVEETANYLRSRL